MFWLRQLLVATLGFLQNQTVGIKKKKNTEFQNLHCF